MDLGPGETLALKPLRLDCLDGEFIKRMPADEWQRVRDFRSTSTFLDALTRYAALMPAHFSNNLLLNKVVTEAKRFEMLVFALYLHETCDPADPRTGLTFSNLRKICKDKNIASPGRVTAILGIMQIAKFLRRVPSQTDTRVVRLQPTPLFLNIVEGWNMAMFEIIDAAAPESALTRAAAENPRLGAGMRTLGAAEILRGWHLLDAYPEVAFFVAHDGGWMLLLHCVAQSCELGERREIAPVSVDLAKFGARFGVSRSHLRRLLERAHAEGYLDAPPRNGAHIALSQNLVASFLTCMASELSFYRERALEALAQPRWSQMRPGAGAAATASDNSKAQAQV